MIWMQISLSSDLTQVSCQSQLCNSTAQAMSCCPPHSGDTRLGPEASSTTLSTPRSLSCLPRQPSLREAGTKRPFCYHHGNADPVSSERAAAQMCMQVRL